MKATIEISLYPLLENYKVVVKEFIADLRRLDKLGVEPNGLSTHVFGELEEMFPALQELTETYLQKYNAVLLFKIGKGHLRSNG